MREKLDKFMASLTLLVVRVLGSEESDYQCPMYFERYIHTFDTEKDNQYPVCGKKYTHLSELWLQPNINETQVLLLRGHIMRNGCLKSWLRIADPCPYCGAKILSRLVNTNANNVRNDNNYSDE